MPSLSHNFNVTESLKKLRSYVEAENYAGHDPYDGLNSPLLSFLSCGQKWPRIVAIQAIKRSPVNLRPLLGVRRGHNPKGLGLFLWGYAKIYKATGDETALARIGELIELLKQTMSRGYSGNCWGYNFDWQSRAFFVPKYTPTIVNSSFIGHALLDTYDYCGLEEALELALPIRNFILNDLNRTYAGDPKTETPKHRNTETPPNRNTETPKHCFSYTPIDQIAVHNASLLGASLLIRLHQYASDDNGYAAALAALDYSMSYQHDDGSWYYAETDYQDWIDSFHTGFNLQSIQYFLNQVEAPQYKEAFDRGMHFYAEQFFLEDGTPKYYHNKTYPIDIHSYAQAIVFFSRQGDDYADLVNRITSNLLETMQDPSGCFYFQRREHKTIKTPYMRWSQSWCFHALTEYLLNQNREAKAPAEPRVAASQS